MIFASDMDEFPMPNDTLRQQLENAVGDFIPGPAHVRAPTVHKLEKRRHGEILHNFCQEALPWYKNLEPVRPQWPKQMKRWTEREGFRVSDLHSIQVSTRDQVQRTQKGTLRTSSGVVTYNAIDKMHMEIDAGDLATILRQQEPHGQSSGRMWSVKKLEKAYHHRFRNNGSWERQGVSFRAYLSLFPKTFDLFGADHDFVRLVCKSRLCAVDFSEDAMISLALACEQGHVARTVPMEGTMAARTDTKRMPELAHVRTRTLFRSTSEPGLKSHTLPSITASRDLLDVSLGLPRNKANTLPVGVPFGCCNNMFPKPGGKWGKNSAEGGGSLASSMRFSDDARSTFRVSFMADRESRSATPVMEFDESDATAGWH